MNILRSILILQFTTTLVVAQSGFQTKPASLPNQPEALVRSLYTEVVARHPIGIPADTNMKIFAPYLSKALIHRIDVAVACAADYDRQYPDPNLKPPFVWLEAGLFSGDDERAEPRAFDIERAQSDKDGSFRVYVKLRWGASPGDQEIWHVAVIVLREDGHFVVDDVIYLKDEGRPVESRLSEYLSAGCDGPRWVGRGTQGADSNQQR
jgi:hypothetical protein